MEIRVNCPDQIHLKRLYAEGNPNPESDRKRKLFINPSKNVAQCFRCGFKTRNAKKICDELAIAIPFGEYPIEEPEPEVTLKLPEDIRYVYSTTPEGQLARDYLKSRRVSMLLAMAYEIGYCVTGRFAGNIIIPIYDNGQLLNFQTRSFIGNNQRYDGPSRKEGAKPNALFNVDRGAKNGVVVLVEGPFDALQLPDFGVALLGSGWNAAKQERLLRLRPKVVLLALDNDDAGYRARKSVTASLGGLVQEITNIPFVGKDLGEVSEDTIRSIRDLCVAYARSLGTIPK